MKNTADRTGMNKGNFQGLTSFKGLVGMLNHLGMSEKKILFTTVSWVSGVCWELKELIVWWFLCQSYQVHFGPKQSAHPCSLPHPHWPQRWGRGFGVEVPDSAIFPEYEMFFRCIILSSMTYSHQLSCFNIHDIQKIPFFAQIHTKWGPFWVPRFF